jgi:TolB-like protein
MKKHVLILILLILIFQFFPAEHIFGKKKKSSINKLAVELQKGAQKMKNKSVAVLPFTYPGKTSEGKNLRILVPDELTTYLVKGGKLTVVERTQVNKILKELKFENLGAVDSTSAQKIGKGLGVEALILGSITQVSKNEYRINARLISVETFKILSASNATVLRSAGLSKKKKDDKKFSRFLEIYSGLSFFKVDYFTRDLINKDKEYYTVYKYNDLSSDPTIPFGIRYFVFINKYIGGALGIEYAKFSVPDQKNIKLDTTVKDASGTTTKSDNVNFIDHAVEYNLFIANFDIVFKISISKFTRENSYVYIGLGLGGVIAWGDVNDPYASENEGGVQNNDTSGVIYIIAGTRIGITKLVGLFGEFRYYPKSILNKISISEDDNIRMLLGGPQVVVGVSFNF